MPAAWKLRPEVLLCPNIPKPLHTVAPRNILGQAWWNKERRTAYASTNKRCIACGVHHSKAKCKQWLEGHELYRTDYALGRLTYLETVPLCHYCHNFIHDGRMENMVQQGAMTQAKFVAVIQHGDAVLLRYGLRRPTKAERDKAIESSELAAWEDWRLVLFGKEYPPAFKTYQDWLKAFGYV